MSLVVVIACFCGAGCGAMSCDDISLVAVDVVVTAPDGSPVDSVTATNDEERACRENSLAPGLSYACSEQGGGTYTIRVNSQGASWTKRVDVAADACHTTELKQVSFDLSADPAD